MPSNYIAYTAPINPAGVTPVLTRDRIWAALEIKITSGETFVSVAITNTDVISTGITETGQKYTDREVTFRDGNRRVKERCIEYKPIKVEFHMHDGSRVMNIVSQGKGGDKDLYMTYTFEWLHPELEGKGEDELARQWEKEQETAKRGVESTIEVMRRLATEGKI
jgi:Domain of unknown function (DUF1857)